MQQKILHAAKVLIATNDNNLAKKLRKLKSFGLSQTALEKI